jgi:hypothetical protein
LSKVTSVHVVVGIPAIHVFGGGEGGIGGGEGGGAGEGGGEGGSGGGGEQAAIWLQAYRKVACALVAEVL